jgi:hypothetical protein
LAQGFDPPWRLDPLKRIINVGWGGSIAVLAMTARLGGSAPVADPPGTWNAFLTATSDDPDMRGLSLLEELGPLLSPPGPPPAVVTSQNDFWCYPRQFSETSEIVTATYHFVDRGKYVIFTSSGVITLHYDALDPINPDVPFLIDFRSPPDLTGGDGLAVLPGNNAGNLLDGYIDRIVNLVFSPRPTTVFPQLIEEIISHDEVVSTRHTEKSWETITFLNLPRIASRWPSIKSAGKLKLVAQMQGVNFRTFLEWSLALGTFVGPKRFVRNDNSPLLVSPDPTKDPVGFHGEQDDRAPETDMPSVEVTFTIDLRTYGVTATRRSL